MVIDIAKYFNPYTYIAGGIVVASVIGGFIYTDHMIHKYHVLYEQDEKKIAVYKDHEAQATKKAADQEKKTSAVIEKVIKVPGPTQTVVKIIHDAPIPVDCKTPALDVLRNNV